MNLKKSPLAPDSFPQMPAVDGLVMWTLRAGVKYQDRDDVLLVRLARGSRVASVFTRSSAPGAPVEWSKSVLEAHFEQTTDEPLGLIVNAGNANVFTGQAGVKAVQGMAKSAAQALGANEQQVFVASTGVIGEPLDIEPITTVLKDTDNHPLADWEQAANAIRTTDTFAKGAFQTVYLDGQCVNICGFIKGSGMIAPDMATMLGFVFTDAAIDKSLLQTWLRDACETTMNAITVDSDTSTSDMVFLAATGRSGAPVIESRDDPRAGEFKRTLYKVLRTLAHLVVRDGEGAKKFISVQVNGARSQEDAKTIAMSIANSPLVKTAIAGEDANWGRVVMAVGKSGAPADRDLLSIHFGPHLVAQNGARAAAYSEDVLSQYMKQDRIDISVDIGLGSDQFTAWTCDLTHGYIDINADYRS